MPLGTQESIIIPRAITRFGDHAWDLAIPILLIRLFPGNLDYIATYSLLYTATVVFAVPRIAQWLNKQNRLRNLAFIIIMQAIGVAVTLLTVLLSDKATISSFVIISIAGVACRVGSSLADISLMADWIPRIFTDHHLGIINSRLRRSDLIMEVTAPFFAGFILLSTWGFELIALINILSFGAEYVLLKRIYHLYQTQLTPFSEAINQTQNRHLLKSLKNTAALPIFPLIIATATVWFTVLTPHGNLLAAHLKDYYHTPEDTLGIVRSLGALVGIIPTLYYSHLVKNLGTFKFAAYHITFQIIALIVAAIALHGVHFLWLSLAAIIISRIGLYGFLLAATEITQREVPEAIRLEVTGVSSSLKYFASMLLYCAAIVWSSSEDFIMLSLGTIIIIGIGAILSWKTALKIPK
jgi:iron-regulated transporter 1